MSCLLTSRHNLFFQQLNSTKLKLTAISTSLKRHKSTVLPSKSCRLGCQLWDGAIMRSETNLKLTAAVRICYNYSGQTGRRILQAQHRHVLVDPQQGFWIKVIQTPVVSSNSYRTHNILFKCMSATASRVPHSSFRLRG